MAKDDSKAAPVSDASAELFKGLDAAPTVLTLKDGDTVGGVFMRWGQIMGSPKEDRLTGEIKASPMKSIVIKGTAIVAGVATKGVYEVLSAHDIDRVLYAVSPGAKVAIQRIGKDEDIGVVRYKVAGG